jgi:polysaccharide pyruvyl transferase WcaK-like protein
MPARPTHIRSDRCSNQVAFLGVRTQFENLGDALIVRELIAKLSMRMPTVLDVSSCTPGFLNALDLGAHRQVRQVNRLGKLRLISQILKHRSKGACCYLLLVPGGRGGEISRLTYIKNCLSTGFLRLLSGLGVRVCHIGISYDRLGPRHSRIVRSRAAFLHAHYVRDHHSLHQLHQVGAKVHGLMPDLALALFTPDGPDGSSGDDIAFSFRIDKHPGRAEEIVAFVQRVCNQYADGRGLRFVSQVRRDDSFMEQLAERIRLSTGRRVMLALADGSIPDCQALYSGCGWIVSNRLHALLLAMSSGASPLAVVDPERDVKILGVLQSIGFESHVATLDESPALPDKLTAEKVSELAENGAQLERVFDAIFSDSSSDRAIR